MLKTVTRGALLLALLGLLTVTFLLGRGDASTAPASPTPSTFYLAIGGSASLGMQPTGVAARPARQTDQGYVDDLVRLEGHRGLSLQATEVGCPGETPVTMLGRDGGDACYRPPTTQLDRAVRFLRDHAGDRGVVTVDLGFNAVRPCMAHHRYDLACVTAGLSSVRASLPQVLTRLAAAAGPRVVLVGLTAYDPFLARLLDDPHGAALAGGSLVQIRRLNEVLREDYHATGFEVADVFRAFHSGDTSPISLGPVGEIPTNVERICQLTWMCETDPFGPDNHPNEAGYMVIAQEIDRVLSASPLLGA